MIYEIHHLFHDLYKNTTHTTHNEPRLIFFYFCDDTSLIGGPRRDATLTRRTRYDMTYRGDRLWVYDFT